MLTYGSNHQLRHNNKAKFGNSEGAQPKYPEQKHWLVLPKRIVSDTETSGNSSAGSLKIDIRIRGVDRNEKINTVMEQFWKEMSAWVSCLIN